MPPLTIAVIIPTLNERDNIEPLLDGVLAADTRLQVLVIDDGSRDGTSDYVQTRAQTDPRVHLLNRGRKLGYATAVQDGMRWALANGATHVLQMDADFSHHPRYIPDILKHCDAYDLVIGSRYTAGGGTRNWSWQRKVLSASANRLARLILGLKVRDCTAGFRCWKRELIEKTDVLNVRVEGYAFLFVTTSACRDARARIREIPIIFADREHGQSKMSRKIILEAMQVLARLGWKRLRRH